MNLLLLLAVPIMAASTGTFRNARIDALDISVNSFLVGRSTVTGIPRFRNGINCTNSTGNCLVFSDGSTQNTAFTGGGSTISVAASLYGNGQSASNPVGVDSSSVAVYTGGKYPAKDGSLITGLTESQISGLTTDLASKASSGTNSDIRAFTLPITNTSSVTITAPSFAVGNTSFTVYGGSASLAYQFTPGSINLTSSTGTITNQSSVTASAFFGDGSHLSGIAASGGSSTQTVSFVVDNFLGQVNGVKTAFTLSQTPSSAQSIVVVLDGLLQSSASDYVYAAPTTVTMTTAPAANSSSFYVQYTVNTSTLPQAMLINSTDTASGAKTLLSSVTALGYANFEIMIASIDATSVSSVTLYYAFQSSRTYRIECHALTDTTGKIMYYAFDGTNSGYAYVDKIDRACSGDDTTRADYGVGVGCHAQPRSATTATADLYSSDMRFVHANGKINGQVASAGDNAGCWGQGVGNCYKVNAAPPTKIAFYASAGTFTSIHCNLYQSPGPGTY